MSREGDLNLPYEDSPPGQSIPLDGSVVACGVVIMAGTMPVPGMGQMACLIYRFANPDGSGFYPAIALVATDEEILNAAVLTRDAGRAAVRATEQQRRL
jgi:hypothetical protein